MWTILLSIQDEKGVTSTTELNLEDSGLPLIQQAFAGEIAKLVDGMTTGAITRVGATFNIPLPSGIKTAPQANSDVEEGARFQFRTANGFYSGMRIPTFDESKIVTGTRAVDLTDSDVAAFVTAMTDGIDMTAAGFVGVTEEPVDKRGEDLVALEFAREQFISSRG